MGYTYKKPTANIATICTFFLIDMDNLNSSGSGRIMTARSSAMLIAAADHPNTLMLMHFASNSPSQNFQAPGMGLH